jgi:hypothetical protein
MLEYSPKPNAKRKQFHEGFINIYKNERNLEEDKQFKLQYLDSERKKQTSSITKH